LNLTLKENNKKGIFGNITGGYGTMDRYNTSAFLNSFEEGKRLSLMAGTGNTSGVSGGPGMPGEMVYAEGGSGGGITRNNTNAGINFNNDFGKKGKLDLGYHTNIN